MVRRSPNHPASAQLAQIPSLPLSAGKQSWNQEVDYRLQAHWLTHKGCEICRYHIAIAWQDDTCKWPSQWLRPLVFTNGLGRCCSQWRPGLCVRSVCNSSRCSACLQNQDNRLSCFFCTPIMESFADIQKNELVPQDVSFCKHNQGCSVSNVTWVLNPCEKSISLLRELSMYSFVEILTVLHEMISSPLWVVMIS